MSKKDVTFQYCDEIIDQFEKVCKHPIVEKSSVYYAGVDLGTACIVVAVLDENRRPVAGRYQYADVVRDGMVVDYFGAVQIIREMKAQLEEELGVEELLYAAAAIPPGTDTLDGGAVKNVIQGAGFEITNLLDESTAANAVLRIKNGAIVDIGGGTAEIAVISLGGIVASRSVRMAGDMFDQAIIAFIKRKYNLLIGERTAEQIKIEIGSAYVLDPELTMEIKGRNLVDGLPKNIVVHSEDVRAALLECLEKITSAIKETLERTPPELSADIIDRGITLTGGGALLRGLDQLIQSETGIDVHVAEDPLDCVAKGAGAVLDHVDVLHDVLDTDGGHM